MRLLLAALFLSTAAGGNEPLQIAAEYYFGRHDFRQALPLWIEILHRQPDSVPAALRVAELKLLAEGRGASRDVLVGFLESGGARLDPEARKSVKERLGQLEATFLTDEGQTIFLQALAKLRAKGCAEALPLLTQAALLEKGNVRVLREKARCEKASGLFDRYYQSLLGAADGNPFDPEVSSRLLEAHVYYRAPQKAAAIVQRDPEVLRTSRERTAYAVALLDSGAEKDAAPVLHGLMDQAKQGSLHPIAYYAIGRALASRGETAATAIVYLERFIGAAARTENTTIDGWDPFRSSERVDSAQKIVATLKGG